jgi:hypothetical protein
VCDEGDEYKKSNVGKRNLFYEKSKVQRDFAIGDIKKVLDHYESTFASAVTLVSNRDGLYRRNNC